MPFANLPAHEKDAFFALLDEYFTSRPDLLSSLQVGGAGGPEHAEAQGASPAVPAAAINAAQRALANPATSRLLATGLQRASTSTSTNTNINADTGRSASVSPASAAAAASVAAAALPSLLSSASSASSSSSSHPAAALNGPSAENEDGNGAPVPAVSVGRVAAAAQAFSAPSLQRTANPSAIHGGTPKRADPGKPVSQKKFGDVDVSSAGAMFRSLRGSTAAKNAPPPTVYTPPAFSGGKQASSAFGPPPVRRVGPSSSSSPASAAQVPAPEPAPEPEEDAQPESVEDAAGEWAEALYDYTSEEAGDLHLRAGERVFVTEQTSSDWWTGEVNGRSGLFPATYVKLL